MVGRAFDNTGALAVRANGPLLRVEAVVLVDGQSAHDAHRPADDARGGVGHEAAPLRGGHDVVGAPPSSCVDGFFVVGASERRRRSEEGREDEGGAAFLQAKILRGAVEDFAVASTDHELGTWVAVENGLGAWVGEDFFLGVYEIEHGYLGGQEVL